MSKHKTTPTLTILAGQGALPATVAAGALAQGFTVHVISFTGQPQPQGLPPVASHTVVPLGAVGRTLATLAATRTTHVAMAGGLHKPSLFSLKPDLAGLKLLGSVKVWHDDALLRAVSSTLQQHGITVLPVTHFAPQLRAPVGFLGKLRPTKAEGQDIQLALHAFQTLATLDIGQALVVHNGTILGVEGAEGTDALITRCASLRGSMTQGSHAGILVKLAKPHQTNLADLPFVGPDTLTLLGQHHYRGLVVQAGQTLLLNQPQLTQQANQNHMFVQSLTPPWVS
jgi:DUF1009 family protein